MNVNVPSTRVNIVSFSSVLRVRPLLPSELSSGDTEVLSTSPSTSSCILAASQAVTGTQVDDLATIFYYDAVLPPETPQSAVYAAVGPSMVTASLSSSPQNAVLFSFGVSNSGKSHTLLGSQTEEGVVGEEAGVLPRIIQGFFTGNNGTAAAASTAASEDEPASTTTTSSSSPTSPIPTVATSLSISMLEIYNEQVIDMLAPPSRLGAKTRAPLKIHQNGPSFEIPALTTHPANDLNAALTLLNTGRTNTTTSTTSMNASSSRGHTVVKITPLMDDGFGSTIEGGSVMIVDMAGLERTKKSAVAGRGMRESAR